MTQLLRLLRFSLTKTAGVTRITPVGWVEKRESVVHGTIFRWQARLPGSGKRVSENFFSRREALYFDELVNDFGYPPPGWEPKNGWVADIPGRVPTVLEACLGAVELKTRVSDRTRADYMRVLGRYLRGTALGGTRVTLVTTTSVREWLRDLQTRGLSAKTIRNVHAVVSESLQNLVESGVISSNFARGEGPRNRKTPGQIHALTREEAQAIIRETQPAYKLLVRMLLETGLRWGEITALQWRDLTAGEIVIRRAWTETKDRAVMILGEPKTTAGYRTIPLSRGLAEALENARCGKTTDYIFTTTTGLVVRHTNFHFRIWRPLITRLHAENKISFEPSIHQLRHTYATWLLASGEVSILSLARAMGHEDPAITLRTYSHLLPGETERLRGAVEGFNLG